MDFLACKYLIIRIDQLVLERKNNIDLVLERKIDIGLLALAKKISIGLYVS